METYKLSNEEHVRNCRENPETRGQNISRSRGSHSPKQCVFVCVRVCERDSL